MFSNTSTKKKRRKPKNRGRWQSKYEKKEFRISLIIPRNKTFPCVVNKGIYFSEHVFGNMFGTFKVITDFWVKKKKLFVIFYKNGLLNYAHVFF